MEERKTGLIEIKEFVPGWRQWTGFGRPDLFSARQGWGPGYPSGEALKATKLAPWSVCARGKQYMVLSAPRG